MALVWGLPALYLVLVALLWAFQERITFPAPRSALPDPVESIGYGEQVELTMHDGTKLRGWFLPPLRRPAPPSYIDVNGIADDGMCCIDVSQADIFIDGNAGRSAGKCAVK